MRTVGIEEELLLVSGRTGRPLSLASRLLEHARTGPDDAPEVPGERRSGRAAEGASGDVDVLTPNGSTDDPGGDLGPEIQQQQIEIDTPVRTSLADLAEDLRLQRDAAITAARAVGARVAASGTSVLPVVPVTTGEPRYARIVDRFGLTGWEQLTCGCHVHVGVASDEEGVAVLDRVRTWLPVLLALSANSPFWQGRDSGYASFRSQAMARWPATGPTDVLGSAQAYHDLVASMVASGVLLDEGMVYFDARLSHRYPTVEIRVADVCPDPADTVLVAALCRALVETAAWQWRAGMDPQPVPTALVRLATWQAGRHGLDGDLLHPATGRPAPAGDVVAALVEHVRPALRDTGDEDLVDARVGAVLSRGNGATRQRATFARTGSLLDVVTDLARLTAGQDHLAAGAGGQ